MDNSQKETNKEVSHLNFKRSENQNFSPTKSHNPFVINLEINLVAWTLFLIAFIFRLYLIGFPPHIVFDELHYGKFVSLYLKGTFYFDSQPPLGKQLIAMIAYLSGYDGNQVFSEIGAEYNSSVPLKMLRFLPILCGSLIIPTSYHIIIELGFNHYTAAFAAILLIIENSLLTQSRFILMDSILLFFSTFGLFVLLKSRSKTKFSTSWTIWLFSSTTLLTFGACVKFAGFLTLLLGLFVILYDFWSSLPNKLIKTSELWLQGFLYFLSFVIWPLIIYLCVFYVHLTVLTKAGPHDNVMTSAFQASLEGGLASITKGQPLEIVHGSQVTLRHTHGRTCWLHSHAQVYPVKYVDGRGSSHQQQVTCYSFKDVNNWWIVKRPEKNDLIVSETLDRIKHGDIIQFIHGMTARSLNSHDVAAPISPQYQEVSCYIDYNISMASQNLWKVDLLNAEETNGYWHTIRSKIRLIHLNSSQALRFSGKQLPDWGFNQHEIVTDKLINQDDTQWNVEEHRYTRLSDQKEREKDMVHAEFVPLTATSLTFWEKMKELQYKMLSFDQENIPDHLYACESPLDWLALTKGIAYWIDSDSNSQIHLIGNIFIWYISILSIFVYCLLSVFYLLRRRRMIFDLSEDDWKTFTNIGLVFLTGYLLHYIPHFLTEKTLFLHHYLPCVVIQCMFLATLLEVIQYGHWYRSIKFLKWLYLLLITILMIGGIYFFIQLLPFSYGVGKWTGEEISKIKWVHSWNFIIHK